MSETVIVYDVNGKQISPKPNVLMQGLKALSVDEIAKFLHKVPAYAQVIKNSIPTETIEVVFTEHTKALKNAGAMFGNSKDGGIAANMYMNGKLVGQASFDELRKFQMPESFVSSISQLMLQQQFNEIIATLERIAVNIERVLEGQHNDRIALSDSAQQQLSEALKINDDSLRKQMLIGAVQTAHQARASLTQTFESDINYISNTKALFFGKQNYEKDIKPRLSVIMETLTVNYLATKTCATAYFELNEPAAMKETLSTYKKQMTSLLTDDMLEKLHSLADDEKSVLFWKNEPQRISKEIEDLINSNHQITFEIPISLLQGENEYE